MCTIEFTDQYNSISSYLTTSLCVIVQCIDKMDLGTAYADDSIAFFCDAVLF